MRKLSLFLILLFVACINLTQASEKVIKVLAIGNSFSENAAEAYLDDLARGGQVKMIIGNMVIGGCSLERHWNNAVQNLPDYSYRKIDLAGNKVVEAKKTLEEAIADEEWDYITFQQASHFSGVYATYFPYLPNLMTYVKARVKNPDVRFAFHLTWAYAKTSAHGGFVKYNNDQLVMFNAIVDAGHRATAKVGIDLIIPAGAAVQYARESELGDTFCHDGYHLNDLGKFIAACVWYEVLTDKPVIENPFKLAETTEAQDAILKESAHRAILHTKRLQERIDKQVKMKNVPVDLLQTGLLENKATLLYFKDVEYTSPHFKLVQTLGLKGYLPEWEARLQEPVDPQTLAQWKKESNLKLEGITAGTSTRLEALEMIYSTIR